MLDMKKRQKLILRNQNDTYLNFFSFSFWFIIDVNKTNNITNQSSFTKIVLDFLYFGFGQKWNEIFFFEWWFLCFLIWHLKSIIQKYSEKRCTFCYEESFLQVLPNAKNTCFCGGLTCKTYNNQFLFVFKRLSKNVFDSSTRLSKLT